MFRLHLPTLSSLVFLSACAAKQPVASGPLQPAPEPGLASMGREAEDGEAVLAADARNVLRLELDPVYFDFDSFELRPETRAYLENVADDLHDRSDVAVTIEGHCDERGTSEYNMALGERRALVITDFLARLGVPRSRLSTISFGEERPAAAGHDEAAWAKNRRGQFVQHESKVASGGSR